MYVIVHLSKLRVLSHLFLWFLFVWTPTSQTNFHDYITSSHRSSHKSSHKLGRSLPSFPRPNVVISFSLLFLFFQDVKATQQLCELNPRCLQPGKRFADWYKLERSRFRGIRYVSHTPFYALLMLIRLGTASCITMLHSSSGYDSFASFVISFGVFKLFHMN